MNEVKEKKMQVEADEMRQIFMDVSERMVKRSDLIENDLTSIFWQARFARYDRGRRNDIAILGETRSGKSTVGMKIMIEDNKYLKSIGLNSKAVDKVPELMFSDQTEFLRFINTEERNLSLCIDEFNIMAKTGYNATTEEALFEHYTDVFAGQYLHRISITTDRVFDKSANIILVVMGTNIEKKMTKLEVIYRDLVTKERHTLGHIWINIGDVTKVWDEEGIKDIVQDKGIKTLEEQKKIDEWAKKDNYVKYQVKKYKRMQLLKERGVKDVRDLEFSPLILECIRRLNKEASIQKVSIDMINLTLEEIRQDMGRVYSAFFMTEASSRTRAILYLITSIHEIYAKIKKGVGKMDVEKETGFREVLSMRKDMLKKKIERQEDLAEVYKDFLRIK